MAEFKTDEFGKLILEVFFTGESSPPASYWIGIGTGTMPPDPSTATLADIVEPVVAGYARKELVRGLTDFPALSQGADGWSITSLYKNFLFDGDSPEDGTYLFLCDVESGTVGRLLAYGDMNAFQISAGDSFDAAYQHTEITS